MPIKIALGVVAVILVVSMGTPWMASCGTANDYAILQLRACPKAVELLGAAPRAAHVGMACGSTESKGGIEQASWRIPVTGDAARGVYRYTFMQVGTAVQFDGQLEVGEHTIDVKRCARVPNTPGDAVAGAGFAGVVASSDHAAIAVGSKCQGSIQIATPKSQAKVECGTVTVYEGQGEAKQDGNKLQYEDLQTSDQDGTPALRIRAEAGHPDGEGGQLEVWDTASTAHPAFRVLLPL